MMLFAMPLHTRARMILWMVLFACIYIYVYAFTCLFMLCSCSVVQRCHLNLMIYFMWFFHLKMQGRVGWATRSTSVRLHCIGQAWTVATPPLQAFSVVHSTASPWWSSDSGFDDGPEAQEGSFFWWWADWSRHITILHACQTFMVEQ